MREAFKGRRFVVLEVILAHACIKAILRSSFLRLRFCIRLHNKIIPKVMAETISNYFGEMIQGKGAVRRTLEKYIIE